MRYGPSMHVPFSSSQFFAVFEAYNNAIWPVQMGLYLLGVVLVLICAFGWRWNGKAVFASLAFLWFWMALAYHIAFFRTINPLAPVFAALFVIEALLLLFAAFSRGLSFAPKRNVAGIIGAALVLYALIFYPALALALGQHYPRVPTFGLPCPTTIFTM